MNKYPWLVRISTKYSQQQRHGHCGGTLVASRYVITACHCTYQYDRKKFPEFPVRGKYGHSEIIVIIGDYKQRSVNETGREKRIKVKSIKRHRKYEVNQPIPGKALNNGYDVAILELEEEVDLTKYTPACLAKQTEGTKYDGEKAVTAGWGLKEIPVVGQPFEYPNEPSEEVSKTNYIILKILHYIICCRKWLIL